MFSDSGNYNVIQTAILRVELYFLWVYMASHPACMGSIPYWFYRTDSTLHDPPKSPNFSTLPLRAMSRFWGFRSRWIILCACMFCVCITTLWFPGTCDWPFVCMCVYVHSIRGITLCACYYPEYRGLCTCVCTHTNVGGSIGVKNHDIQPSCKSVLHRLQSVSGFITLPFYIDRRRVRALRSKSLTASVVLAVSERLCTFCCEGTLSHAASAMCSTASRGLHMPSCFHRDAAQVHLALLCLMHPTCSSSQWWWCEIRQKEGEIW